MPSSAVCTPSRYSLLTGSYPWSSPLKSGVLGGTDPAIIAPGQETIAGLAKSSGYRTGAFGKWHLGVNWKTQDGERLTAFGTDAFRSNMQSSGRNTDYGQPYTGGPNDRGVDRYFGISGSLDMPPYCFLDQDRTVGIPDIEKRDLVTSQRVGLQTEGWHDDQVDLTITNAARKWIGQAMREDEPFFAYIVSAAPHRPCVPPEFVRGKSDAGLRGDAVCLVDWTIGSLIETVDQHGQLDNTLVIFTSDNGAPTMFPEDGDAIEHKPNGPWRGQKADAWEGGTVFQ